MRLYRYVGPAKIAERVGSGPAGHPIRSVEDIREWLRESGQDSRLANVIATFIVDADGTLLVADRRSEHVVCAGGMPVQSAGEITFEIGKHAGVVAVSNQSTGYCPEPESWSAVASALHAIGLESPDGFERACDFRRCPKCGSINLVKDGMFECDVCRSELPAVYNVR